jgi:hypothetical protein
MVNDQLTELLSQGGCCASHRRIDRHSLAVLVVRPMYQSRRSARPVNRAQKQVAGRNK